MSAFKRLVAAAVMASAATVASAQIVVPWGSHNAGELGGTLFFGTGADFPFEVVYTFTQSGRASVDFQVSGVANNAVGGIFGISGATIGLYQNNGNANFNDDVLVSSFGFGGTSTTNTFSGVANGLYYYKVTGNVTGPRGGSYLLSSAEVGAAPQPSEAGGQIVVPWGAHDPGELGGTLFFSSTNTDTAVVYTFSLGALSDLLAVGVSNDSGSAFGIAGGSIGLFLSNGNADFTDDAMIGDFAIGDSSTTHIFHSVAAGSYYYKFLGGVNGEQGGSYLVSSATLPPTGVPEPATTTLVLGGLLIFGWMSRRRIPQLLRLQA